jgi:hypothetical protein
MEKHPYISQIRSISVTNELATKADYKACPQPVELESLGWGPPSDSDTHI